MKPNQMANYLKNFFCWVRLEKDNWLWSTVFLLEFLTSEGLIICLKNGRLTVKCQLSFKLQSRLWILLSVVVGLIFAKTSSSHRHAKILVPNSSLYFLVLHMTMFSYPLAIQHQFLPWDYSHEPEDDAEEAAKQV